ncbi:amidase family protein [Nocardia brasiliensis]|uniref:amidase family protein n=1 Tax=Nocardia brasiliensis TaxID=37326 RepID=UPI0024573AF3|nr:amidase family protein [Nocardia brasiliensis]
MLGLGRFTVSSTFGVPRNPWHRPRPPGGPRGGSPAGVAAGLVPVAMGSDGGGSIRIPSACCGLFGLKPQRGRVPVAPSDHLWLTLGVLGPLARGVLDAAIVFDVIRGNVPGARFTAPEPAVSFEQAVRQPGAPLRIGYSTKSVTPLAKPDPEHVRAVRDTAKLLTELGHSVFEVDPGYHESTHAFYPQFFGGVRAEAAAVEHPQFLERRTRQTVRMGAWARGPVLDWAIRQGEALARKADRVFADCDLLLTPTLAGRPPRIGVLDGANTIGAQLASIPMIAYTALWNVTGHPAASLPAGVGADGLPLAVQLVGPSNGETTILSAAAQLEQARPHPRPPA